MRLIKVDPRSLYPTEKDPDTKHVRQLAHAMRFGYWPGGMPPVIVTDYGDGVLSILEGHHRTEAARMIGLRSIPAIEVPVSLVGELHDSREAIERRAMAWYEKQKNRRPNPPLSEEQFTDPQPRGGECFVFSVATATGQPVETVRRTMIQNGIDIWNEAGFARGIFDREQMAKTISLLDTRKRVFSMAVVAPPPYGGAQTKYQAMGPSYAPIRGFLSKEGLDVGFSHQDKPVTVDSLVRLARKHGNAMIAVLASRARVTKRYARTVEGHRVVVGRTIRGSSHAIAYSPSKGFIDISIRSPHAARLYQERRAMAYAGTDPGPATKEEVEYFAHGDSVPQPRRLAFVWIFFRGE